MAGRGKTNPLPIVSSAFVVEEDEDQESNNDQDGYDEEGIDDEETSGSFYNIKEPEGQSEHQTRKGTKVAGKGRGRGKGLPSLGTGAGKGKRVRNSEKGTAVRLQVSGKGRGKTPSASYTFEGDGDGDDDDDEDEGQNHADGAGKFNFDESGDGDQRESDDADNGQDEETDHIGHEEMEGEEKGYYKEERKKEAGVRRIGDDRDVVEIQAGSDDEEEGEGEEDDDEDGDEEDEEEEHDELEEEEQADDDEDEEEAENEEDLEEVKDEDEESEDENDEEVDEETYNNNGEAGYVVVKARHDHNSLHPTKRKWADANLEEEDLKDDSLLLDYEPIRMGLDLEFGMGLEDVGMGHMGFGMSRNVPEMDLDFVDIGMHDELSLRSNMGNNAIFAPAFFVEGNRRTVNWWEGGAS